jgi:hypothetical protein
VTALQKLMGALRAQNDDLLAKNRLSEMFRFAQQKRFGKSSEAYPGQGELFNEAQELVEQAVGVDEEETITYKRHKPKREKYQPTFLVSMSFTILAMKTKSAIAASMRFTQ